MSISCDIGKLIHVQYVINVDLHLSIVGRDHFHRACDLSHQPTIRWLLHMNNVITCRVFASVRQMKLKIRDL